MTYEIKYRDKEEMKDSGIEWINEIPYNWEIKKVKHTSKLITGDSISASDKDQYYSEELNDYYQYVGTKDIDVNTNQIDYNNDLYIPLKNSFNIANPNTFFICIEGGSAGRKIAYNNRKVCYVNKLCNIETKKGYSNKLLYYIFQSKEFTTQFNIKTTGIIPGISTSDLGNLFLSISNKNEQHKISNFLDYKTSQFDSIIEKKEKLIEKLEEAKKSLISEVVTGKVKIVDGKLVKRDESEMKDSGVEWLGKIPEDWSLKKIKYQVEKKEYKETYKDNANYIGLENIESFSGRLIKTEENNNITGVCNIYKKGNVLFGKLRPYLAKSVIAKNNGYCSTELLVLNPKKLSAETLNYIFLNEKFIDFVNSSTYGAKMPRANWEFIGNIEIPEYEESFEEKMINTLKHYSKDHFKIKARIEKQIKNLKQAKQSLISEAVTGKIDLRDWEMKEINN